jgi:hypothetical protein
MQYGSVALRYTRGCLTSLVARDGRLEGLWKERVSRWVAEIGESWGHAAHLMITVHAMDVTHYSREYGRRRSLGQIAVPWQDSHLVVKGR